jgi:hypothetical protein
VVSGFFCIFVRVMSINMKTYRVIIAGSRKFNDYAKAEGEL